MAETMTDGRLRMLARLDRGRVQGDLAAELLAARGALRAADALAEEAIAARQGRAFALADAYRTARAARGAR